jgi:hypothetical protein
MPLIILVVDENLLWKVLTGDRLYFDETASTIVVGRAYVKHRFSHTNCTASDVSRRFAHLRSLREHERG